MTNATTLPATTPPGRASRKARAFGSEIARLRRDGHTFEAIRTFLAAAGVFVSKSTVHREAARQCPAATDVRLRDRHLARSDSVVARPQSRPAPDGRIASRSQEFAQAYMDSQITNPLMLQRMRDEDGRH